LSLARFFAQLFFVASGSSRLVRQTLVIQGVFIWIGITDFSEKGELNKWKNGLILIKENVKSIAPAMPVSLATLAFDWFFINDSL
jgi:hypothetical protein